MVKTIYKIKKIDVKIKKREQKLRKKLAEKIENETNCHHELIMIKAKKQRIKFQT